MDLYTNIHDSRVIYLYKVLRQTWIYNANSDAVHNKGKGFSIAQLHLQSIKYRTDLIKLPAQKERLHILYSPFPSHGCQINY